MIDQLFTKRTFLAPCNTFLLIPWVTPYPLHILTFHMRTTQGFHIKRPSFGSPQVSSDAVVPARSLYSKPIRTVLSDHLVKVVMRQGWSVTAIRLSWPRDEASNQHAWRQLVLLRSELDELARSFPGAALIVSAITGGLVGQRKVYPGVGFWIATHKPVTDCKVVLDHFHRNSSGATAKLLLQPYQTQEKDYSTVLFHMVKDNVSGCVPRHVQESVSLVWGKETAQWEPVVKIFVQEPSLKGSLDSLTKELEAVNFPIPIID